MRIPARVLVGIVLESVVSAFGKDLGKGSGRFSRIRVRLLHNDFDGRFATACSDGFRHGFWQEV